MNSVTIGSITCISSNLGHKFVPNVVFVKSKLFRRDEKLLFVNVDNDPWTESLDTADEGGDFDPLNVWDSNDNFRLFLDEPFERVAKELSGVSSIDLWILLEFRVKDKREVNDVNEDFVVDTEGFADVNAVVSDKNEA